MKPLPLISKLCTLAFTASLLALAITPRANAAPPDSVDVLILFGDRPGPEELGVVVRHGGKVTREFKIVPGVAATLPSAALERLKREPKIISIEPDGKVFGHDIDATWGVKRIGCGAAHIGNFAANRSPQLANGVKVAVVDSGIDYTHPELVLNYAGGYDFVNGDTDPMDDHGHGTHVAGTVGAIRNGAGVVGAAPEAALYGLKVLGADGSGSYSWIISALDWCVANGIEVANFSLGSAGYPGSTVEAAFNNAEAAGIVLVASAGNSGEGADTVGYPAKFASVIAVASTTSADVRSGFSSTGPDVEIAAPGSSIYSTTMGGGFGYKSGTSMASPHVAGTAALVIGAGIADGDADGKVNDDVRSLLQITAEDLGVAGRDNYFGFGLADAELAVAMAYNPGSGDPAPVFDAPSNLAGSVSGTTVTLGWSDNANTEEGFQLQYGTKSKGRVTWGELATVGADVTGYSKTMSSGTYLFRVRAFKDQGTSFTGWSNEINLTLDGGGGGSKPPRGKK